MLYIMCCFCITQKHFHSQNYIFVHLSLITEHMMLMLICQVRQ